VQAEKRALRASLRARAHPAGEAALACGRAAVRHLAADPALLHARRVALFAATPGEIPTRPLFELLRRMGRSALLPRIRQGDGLDFVALQRWDDLRPGAQGVPEPPEGAAAVALGRGDLVLVPGLGFDRRGRRIGRGGGHYDRTFPPGAQAPLLLGFAFACQLVGEVPTLAHDRWMDGLVTEHGVLRSSPGEGSA